MKNFLIITGLIVFCSVSIACSKNHSTQKNSHVTDSVKTDMGGWFKAGNKPGFYEIGQAEGLYNESNIYYIKSTENVENGFGTIMSGFEPGKYSGKRVRLSGNIRTEKVEIHAGIWFRVDGYTPGLMLGFDNMTNRPINGTTAWQKYEIVLDVPDTSAYLAYGVLLNGNGSVFLSGITFEIVGNDIPVTNMLTETVQVPVKKGFKDELPALIRNIPDGIEVKHSPVEVLAVKTKDDTTMLYWFHNTSVKAVNEDIEITEFGSYVWLQDHWEFGNVGGAPFSPKDFADWYECKNSKLEKGKEYTDKNNWSRWPSLQRTTSLWYYIGKNKKGELFKGTAIVNYLPEMKK